MGPHEPYWRTNTSFSPPPQRWDFRFQHEGQSFGSQEGSRLYGSSTSSNSRESRSWLRGGYLPNHQHSVSDGVGVVFSSSPSDLSPNQQWTTPAIQEISLYEYANSSKRVFGPLSFSPTSEGLSAPHDSRASISSHSDSSDFETMVKSLSSHHNFSNRRCFMSKPVHPLTTSLSRPSPGLHDSSDFDFSDVSEPTESDSNRLIGGEKCGLCDRFLSQRSPWSSRQIVRSGDMPVTGVLPCRHVFHAECLDQTTPKTHKGDPPCPVCAKSEGKNSPEQRVLSKLKNGFPRLRRFREDGNGMLLFNRSRLKKGLSLKGKLKKSGMCDGGGGGDGVGCSMAASNSRKKL